MITIVTRAATPADLADVLALYRELRPHDPALSPERARVLWDGLQEDPQVTIIVATCDDVVAATCMLAFIPNLASGGRPIGMIEHVITAARFRRRGLARAVLQAALGRAWARDCCKVVLLSGADRPQAHGLYEALGFRGDVERGFVIKPPAPAP
jgi:ribosomal protein S18 acetylase RimI-like enzyme